jgi:hypothetical protein
MANTTTSPNLGMLPLQLESAVEVPEEMKQNVLVTPLNGLVNWARSNSLELNITARTTSGAVFVREAVVDLGSPRSPKTIFRRWTRGTERAVITASRLTEKQVLTC